MDVIVNISRQTSQSRVDGGLRCSRELTPAPVLSVLTVVKNGAATIEALIRSVASQGRNGIEFIVVDGGSIDGTVEILRRNDDVIDYWVSESDRGVYDAFNKAIGLARGEYYVFAGADDTFDPGALRSLITSKLFHDKPDYITCAVRCGSIVKDFYRPHLGWIRHNLILPSHSVGTIIRKGVHQVIGPYPVHLRILADGIIIKALAYGKFTHRKSSIVNGTFFEGGLSSQKYAEVMWEGFQVQLSTEKYKYLQLMIFIVRLIKNFRNLLNSVVPPSDRM